VYPGLERELEQVLTELATMRRLIDVPHPRSGVIEPLEITREGFLGALRMALYSPDSTALIPLIIHAAHRGDFGPLAALSLASSRNAKTLSLGLYLTISCAEEMQGVDAAALHEAVAGLRWFGDQSLLELADICTKWTPAVLPDDVREPTRADAPTLLLSGAYDPVTPPRFGEHVAAQLGDARHVVVEHGHHSLSWRGCAPRLLAEFFADPRPDALDVSCMIEQPARRFFVSPNGPRRLQGHVEPPRRLGDDRPELATKEPER
jgi:pimeloyl-ACP methyl ester carboxylesterase